MIAWRRVTFVLTLLYGGVYLLWRFALVSPFYDVYWQLRLSQVFGSWFYVPLLPLAVAALWSRSKAGAVLLVIPLLFFSVEYGRQFLPNWTFRPSTADTEQRVRVMSWNMLYSEDRRGEFLDVVATVRPDVIAVQEIGVFGGRKISEELREEYPFQSLIISGSARNLGLFSRYPMVEEHMESDYWGCLCQRVQVQHEAGEFTVINVHVFPPELMLNWWSKFPSVADFDARHQAQTFDKLIEQIELSESPLIVMGDMNTTERQPNFRRLLGYLRDTQAVAGWGMGYTFPSPEAFASLNVVPVIRIDHVLVDSGWNVQDVWRGSIAGSDHLYIAAELTSVSAAMTPERQASAGGNLR